MARHPSHLVELAKRGAEVQFRNLLNEAKLLVELFPHLRDSYDPDELPVSFLVARGARRGARRSKAMKGKSGRRRKAGRRG